MLPKITGSAMMSTYPVLLRFALYAPVLAVWTTGIIIAVVTWRKHPHVSLLAAVAFALQILQSTVGMLIFYAMTQGGIAGVGAWERGWFMDVASFVQVGISAIAWALILVAIFRWRRQP